MPLPTRLLLYWFWLTEIFICRKSRPTRDETHDLQIALPTMLMLPFFYTSSTLHVRHICTSFELWGRPFCSSLLVSIFLLLWKEFNSHSFVVTFHFSRLLSSPSVFYPAVDSCWIHGNIGCYACIYSIHSLSLWATNPGWLITGSSQQVLRFNFTTQMDQRTRKLMTI